MLLIKFIIISRANSAVRP